MIRPTFSRIAQQRARIDAARPCSALQARVQAQHVRAHSSLPAPVPPRWQQRRAASIFTGRKERLRRPGERIPTLGKDSPKEVWEYYWHERRTKTLTTFVMIFITSTIIALYLSSITPRNHHYPEPVAALLRQALLLTHKKTEPEEATRLYHAALSMAQDEYGMADTSDGVIGIRLKIAALQEKLRRWDESIDSLKVVRDTCYDFLEREGRRPGREADAVRARKWVVQVCMKLGDLYALSYVNDLEAAEESYTRGVELALSESLRREHRRRQAMDKAHRNSIDNSSNDATNTVKDGPVAAVMAADRGGIGNNSSSSANENDEVELQAQRDAAADDAVPWLSSEEIGATLERLAQLYEARSMHGLAAPLFLRAITLGPPPCHAAVLMNNLSISLAQTAAPAPSAQGAAAAAAEAPPSRAALIANARQWAEKALAVAQQVSGEARTDECDVGCAVAIHNIGEFAEMEGGFAEARRRYNEALARAKAIGFEQGEANAKEGLRRLREKSKREKEEGSR